MKVILRVSLLGAALTACGDDTFDEAGVDAGSPSVDVGSSDSEGTDAGRLPYAQRVVDFAPGPGAGFGRDDFPSVVLGPPVGLGTEAGSLDVLSLGVGGSIILDFGDREIVDGAGPDFVVFENPFWVMGDPSQVFQELGQVSVSTDAVHWRSFPCDGSEPEPGRFPGCAGWTPTQAFEGSELLPLDPQLSGGDAFDLAELGLSRVRFVRIEDLSEDGQGPTAGFDLDAVGAVYLEPR